MSGPSSEKLSRVRQMSSKHGAIIWDLSPNDQAALRHVLGLVNKLASEVAEYEGTTVPDVLEKFGDANEERDE